LTKYFVQFIMVVMRGHEPDRIHCIASPRQAAALLHPLRAALLRAALEPVSATELAGRFGLTRQKVNYHVRALARAGLLRRAGRRRKRNMIEQRYVATARSYVLSPDVIGAAGAHAQHESGPTPEDAFSAAYAFSMMARSQAELGRALQAATASGKRLSTLSLATELRFESAAQRARFAQALRTAVLAVVASHASPVTLPDGGAGPGRPYRLMLACHPIPREKGS
jgi:DNA-binding transcriptional ArsR family regulator